MILALVTDASSGLGEAIARLFAKKRIPLILTGRDPERLKTVARSLSAEFLAADLVKNRALLLELIRDRKPDLVVNNAGFSLYGPALLHPTSSQMGILEVNANAALEIALEAARALQSQKRPGVIVNISSAAGELPFPNMAVYAASKAFLTSFSKSFDAEMRPFGIRVLAALPGQIATPFAERASLGSFRQRRSLFTMSPEYVAQKIWDQIEQGKGVSVIDWRYRLALMLARLTPRCWLEKALGRSISRRIAEEIGKGRNE